MKKLQGERGRSVRLRCAHKQQPGVTRPGIVQPIHVLIQRKGCVNLSSWMPEDSTYKDRLALHLFQLSKKYFGCIFAFVCASSAAI